MIEYREHITRAMLRAEPGVLFVFGDNLQRRGYGGQAKEMRGEPNAVGIPTKAWPSMTETAFFNDDDLKLWAQESAPYRERLIEHGGKVVWPKDGIGTGLAQLQERAPAIWRAIERLRLALEESSVIAPVPETKQEGSENG